MHWERDPKLIIWSMTAEGSKKSSFLVECIALIEEDADERAGKNWEGPPIKFIHMTEQRGGFKLSFWFLLTDSNSNVLHSYHAVDLSSGWCNNLRYFLLLTRSYQTPFAVAYEISKEDLGFSSRWLWTSWKSELSSISKINFNCSLV